MTLTQLEYIVALDTWRHFTVTAEKCFVTQPTLSMQIQKLEDELGLKLFDRSRMPVVPTHEGEAVLAQARVVLGESERLREIVRQRKGELSGELRLGIIPTLAPYLLGLFLDGFLKGYPNVRLSVSELTTETIVERLKRNALDAGLLATPLSDPGLSEYPLFYEEYVAYLSPDERALERDTLKPSDIDVEHLWLLEEGHCMRSQIEQLCELKTKTVNRNFRYEAGSVETLKKMVDTRQGLTIIPELALADLRPGQEGLVRRFQDPAPAREISIVTHRDFVKERLLTALRDEVLKTLPEGLRVNKPKTVLTVGRRT